MSYESQQLSEAGSGGQMRWSKKRFPAKAVLVGIILTLSVVTIAGVSCIADQILCGSGGSAQIFILGGLFICVLTLLLCAVWLFYRGFSTRSVLMRTALYTLGKAYPQIARINYRTGQCVFIKDQENPACRLFEVCSWDDVRAALLNIVHPEDTEKCRTFTSMENMRRVRRLGLDSDTCVYRRSRKGDYQWIQAIIVPAPGEKNQDYAILYTRDVDDSMKAEELYKAQLWEGMLKARESESEKTEFLKYMVHSTRAPLSAVSDLSDLACGLMEKGEIQKAEYYLKFVGRMGSYVSTVMEDTAEFSVWKEQRQACEREPFWLEGLMSGCREYCELQGREKNISLEFEVDSRLRPGYIGDVNRLMGILYNLLANAFQFSQENSCVRLEAKLEESSGRADRVLFCVNDKGKGINREFLPRAFDLFTREQPGEGGTGLGLAMARAMAEAMEGVILAESVPGQGSSFRLEVLLEYVPKEIRDLYHAKKTGYFRILLMDSRELPLKNAADILVMDGYKVVGCSGGGETLGAFVSRMPENFDLLLTDIPISEMDQARQAGDSVPENFEGRIRIMALAAGTERRESRDTRKYDRKTFLERTFRIEKFSHFVRKNRGSI